MVMVPVRADEEVLAATLKPTVPLPEPLPPLVIVSQAALLVAVHAQALVVVTAVEEAWPALPAASDAGVMA
jgi:hypothetical protein